MSDNKSKHARGAYREDLAYVHDVGFRRFACSAAPGVLELLRRAEIGEGLVVDLGCGSGLWADVLVRAGYEVHGIDISAAMIKLARARVPAAKFRRGAILDARLPRCDAVTSLGECLNYLFDPRMGPRPLKRVFRRVHRALRPGGLFVFDLAVPGRWRDTRHGHWQGDGWACLVDREEDPVRRQLTRHITTFRKVGRHYRRDQETHRLQLYRPLEIAAQLRDIGFRVRTVRRYGTFPLARHHVGFVARKP